MVTATAVAEASLTLTEAGKLHVGADVTTGVMVQARLTTPLNDPVALTAKLEVTLCPADTVDELELPDTLPNVKSGTAVPVPDSETNCDPLPALSVTTKFADATPRAVGANITLIVQLAEG